MILTTPALVLHTTQYSESSLIAKVFTKELGVRSYILKGVRTAMGKARQNLLQPLSYLEMTVYNNPKKQLQYVKEMHPMRQWPSIGSDMVRSALLFFMDEALYRALQEEEPNAALFDYVVAVLESLEADGLDKSSLPITFLLRLSRHLGIEPMDNYSLHEPLFNLKEGRFLAPPSLFARQSDPNVDYFLDASASTRLHYLVMSACDKGPAPMLTRHQRGEVITTLLEYFQIHLSDFRHFNSHTILHEVLD